MYKQYSSVYAGHIEQFIEMKRKLGFKFRTPEVVLRLFDRLAEKTGARSTGITKELADHWGKREPNESHQYWYCRVQVVAMFSGFLRDNGVGSYVFRLPPFPKHNFIPHIYSPVEIGAIFNAADRLVVRQRNMQSCIFSVPAMFRLLYSTGVRIGEALALDEKDINVDEQYLRVRDSKNGKERIIPISDALTSVLNQYLEQKRRLPIINGTNYFFVGLNGRRCSQQAIGHGLKHASLRLA